MDIDQVLHTLLFRAYSFIHSVIHSFIQGISIGLLQVHYYSEAQLNHHRQLRVKDLPKVPMWWLERDSNPRPFRTKGKESTNERPRPNDTDAMSLSSGA